MTIRENISIGVSANDGTGDTLRSGGDKINRNFIKIWQRLGGDSDEFSSQVFLEDSAVVWEGTSVDAFETRLVAANPTADRVVTIPDATGVIVFDTNTQTLTNKTLTSPVLTTPRINDTSADHRYIFAVSELAADRTITLPLLSGNDTFVFAAHTQTLTNKTLTAPVISSPRISTAIVDANGANLSTLTATASAVNHLSIANAATGAGPTISSIGADSDVNLNLTSKNGGAVRVSKFALRSTTVTADGGVPRAFSHIDCNKATQLNLTLANGTVSGEQKVFTNRGAGNVVCTVTSFANGSSFTLAQNEGVTLTWDGLRWFVTGGYSVLTVA